MDKSVFDKVLNGDILQKNDLTADEKKRLFAMVVDHGASESFAYTRFFRDGFQPWEIDGILKIKRDYMQQLRQENIKVGLRYDGGFKWHCVCVKPEELRTNGESREVVFDLSVPGDFWRFLTEVKRKTIFAQYMADRGMRSAVTVTKRFCTEDWMAIENEGVRTLINEFIEHEQKQGGEGRSSA